MKQKRFQNISILALGFCLFGITATPLYAARHQCPHYALGDLIPDEEVNEVDQLAMTQVYWGTSVHFADLNSDGIVNVHDLIALATLHGPADTKDHFRQHSDLRNDGVVDRLDLEFVLLNYNTIGNGGGQPGAADPNCDRIVNVFDLLQIIDNWGPVTGQR